MYCKTCSAKLPEGIKYCTSCGTKVSNKNDTWECGNCGFNVDRGQKNCPKCGDSYELSVEYLKAHPNEKLYEANFVQEDGLIKRVFSKIIIVAFLGGLLIMSILLLRYLTS